MVYIYHPTATNCSTQSQGIVPFTIRWGLENISMPNSASDILLSNLYTIFSYIGPTPIESVSRTGPIRLGLSIACFLRFTKMPSLAFLEPCHHTDETYCHVR